jgi:Flp pilus assembly protein CpaB
VALALISGVSAVERKPAATATVVTASRDLSAGALLRPGDLRIAALPRAAAPAGSYPDPTAVVGRQLAAPLRAGEPVTDVRLDAGVLATPGRGLVSAAVRFADAEAARLLRPGQRVDVLAASVATDANTAPNAAAVVAANVDVLAVMRPAETSGTTGSTGGVVGADAASDGALVILATTPTQARQLAQAQVTARLSAIVVG